MSNRSRNGPSLRGIKAILPWPPRKIEAPTPANWRAPGLEYDYVRSFHKLKPKTKGALTFEKSPEEIAAMIRENELENAEIDRQIARQREAKRRQASINRLNRTGPKGCKQCGGHVDRLNLRCARKVSGEFFCYCCKSCMDKHARSVSNPSFRKELIKRKYLLTECIVCGKDVNCLGLRKTLVYQDVKFACCSGTCKKTFLKKAASLKVKYLAIIKLS
jgi:hypothetical protein